MNINEIKNRITALAKEHVNIENGIENLKDSDWLEQEGFELIVDFCENQDYQVNGFPHQRKDELKDDENEQEYYRLYVDILTISQEDVSDLHWHWVSSFWPNEYHNKADFISAIHDRLNGSFYDVSLE